ncbi:hypothetical protein MXB_1315, partial [Myxobolus squamalis]
MLINNHLPHKESKFYPLLNNFFPRLYDIKYMIRDCRDIGGGLIKLCELLNSIKVEIIGPSHFAGYDSINTGRLFFKIL